MCVHRIHLIYAPPKSHELKTIEAYSQTWRRLTREEFGYLMLAYGSRFAETESISDSSMQLLLWGTKTRKEPEEVDIVGKLISERGW
jgi:hypothetical protein